MTESEDSEALIELFKLLEEKQKPECPLATQQVFFVKTCQFFQNHPKCVWCKLTPLALEMVHLFSLPPNPLSDIFYKITADCLSSCSNCVSTYHSERINFFKRLAEHYEADALKIFESKIEEWDIERLAAILGSFLNGSIEAANPKLLYSLFEILGFPYMLSHQKLDHVFCKTLQLLITQKKMLKVSQLMPGIIFLSFHSDDQIRQWARSLMHSKLGKPSKWVAQSLNISKLMRNARSTIGNAEVFQSAIHVLQWYPTESLVIDYRWVIDCLNQIEIEDVDSVRMLCVFLKRLSMDKRLLMLGDLSLLDFVRKLFANPKLVSLIDKHALFPVVECDILDCSWEACLTEWIRLSSNAACKLKDGILLKLIVDNLSRILPQLKSTDASNNILSMLINIVHYCTTAEDLGDERFYIVSVKKTLEFLVTFFIEQTGTNKPSTILLQSIKTCIQFDLNELEYSVANEDSASTQSDSLFSTISKTLSRFIENRTLFDAVFDICVKLFGDSEEKLFTKALKSRLAYLDFLATSWPLLMLPSATLEERQVQILLSVIVFSKTTVPQDYAEKIVRTNLVPFMLAQGNLLKKSKVLLSDPSQFHEFMTEISDFMSSILIPLAFQKNGDQLSGLKNSLYLKLHCVSSISSLLNHFSSAKPEFQTPQLWKSFYDSSRMFSTVVDALGIDALKQCIRENAGMQRRFVNLARWILIFCKNCTFLEPLISKSLVSFLIICLKLCVVMKISVTNLDRSLSMYFGSFQIDQSTASQIKSAITSYEAEFSVKLTVNLPVKPEVPSIPTQRDVVEIESLLLKKLQEDNSKRDRIPSVYPQLLPSKPSSKIGQLRQDLAKEVVPVKTIPRKKANQAVHHTAKTVKLDVYGRDHNHSSDAEETEDFVGEVRDNLTFMGNQTKEFTGRQVKMIELKDQVDLTKTGKARLSEEDSFYADPVCSIKKLHKYLLDLDFDSLDDRSLEGFNARPIPDRFGSIDDYVSCFEPLLLFECRSQLLQAKMELDSMQAFPVKVMAISNVDYYHEVTVGVDPARDEDEDNSQGNNRLLGDHDYVVARLDPSDSSSEIIGIVMQASYKGAKTEAIIKFRFRSHQSRWQQELRIGLVWKVKKLCNWVTCIREYSALHAIGDLRLCKSILAPPSLPIDSEVVEKTSRMLERSLEVNPSQALSIATALNNPNPFTLIQGPPGTGKTRTILGLVGALFGRPCPTLTSKLRPQRLLICAPSNAAIDEIVRRLKAGIFDCYHQQFSPKVLRLGSHEMIHEEVKDLTLDATIERQFSLACKDSLNLLKEQKESLARLKKDLDFAEIHADPTEQQRLRQELWSLKESLKKNNGFIDGTRQNLRNKVVSEAQVVCTTLSSSGIDLLSKLQFDVVIIDEACQAVEISALIPLQYGCKHCILVGDPNQLPPTVISQAASVFAYEQSLFQRVQKSNPEAVQLLSVQYRMHPMISTFPNRYFYDGRLDDGPGMDRLNARPWHENKALKPYLFYDIHGSERNQLRRSGEQGTSKSNETEAKACLALVSYLCSQAPDMNFSGKIGIVTPYKDQKRALRREFKRRFGPDIANAIEISTDGYQGQEKEIIIFSCVRTCESKGIGFLNDARRLNVALTRAKCSLFILGKADALLRNSLWRELIQDSKERGCFVPYDNGFWPGKYNLRPNNIFPRRSPPKMVSEAREHPAPPVAHKIKTPMQRRREEIASVAPPPPPPASVPVKAPARKPLLLDSLLDKISKEN